MKTLRQTILNQYSTCPFMCYHQWGELGEEKEPEYSGTKYTEVGILVHEVMEEWTKKGCEESYEGYHKMADEKLDNLDKSLFKNNTEIEDYRISIHEQLDWLFEHTSSKEILGEEVTFSIPSSSMLREVDTVITGTIDRIDGNLEQKRATILDYKTGKPYTKKSLKTNVQAFLYSMAFYQMYGFLPEKFVFVFSKFKKKMVIWITPEFLQEAGTEVISIYLKMKNGEFEPVDNANKFFCNNFCNAKRECPKYVKKVEGLSEAWAKLL